VYSGTLNIGDSVQIAGTDKKEKILKILNVHASKREEIKSTYSGQIVALPGLKFAGTGDTLCDIKNQILFEKIRFIAPVINQAIEAKTLADQDKLLEALKRLADEDPTFKYNNDADSGQIIISGVGELHLEIIVDRLKREFNLETRVGNPQVAYKETITQEVIKEGQFDRITGKNMFGWVKLSIKPAKDEGIIINNELLDKKGKINIEKAERLIQQTPALQSNASPLRKGGMPIEMITAAMEGAKEALNVGTSGFPMTDIKVNILEMKYIEGESDPIAYKIAASVAIKDAVRSAMPILLEPMFRVEITSPEEYVGDIIADMSSRKGRIEGVELKGNSQLIKCIAPLSEMFGYVTKLRSASQGRASYSMFFNNYEPTGKEIK